MLNPTEIWAHPICTVSYIICPILQMRKLRLRDLVKDAQSVRTELMPHTPVAGLLELLEPQG